MSSQVAKAASNVVSIAKVRTTNTASEANRPVDWYLGDLPPLPGHRPRALQRCPLNPHFRNPPPGANDPLQYEDPVTLPAGDIADNPYWKRDNRRNYPQLSVVNQSQFAQLLTIGSAEAPKVDLIGEAGEKQLVAVKQESETGLAKALEKASNATKDVFVNGMPPLPSGQTLNTGKWDVHKYELEESSYGEGYPCRSFK
ncbi:hypothetical protein SNK04_003738 [Fusarium graminearum]